MGKFFRIDNKAALESVVTESNVGPVVIFKHSIACPISSRAYREMEKLKGDVNLIVVQSDHEISAELSDMTGICHETPQVIVFRDGKAVWNASHFDVNETSVNEALQANG